MRLKMSRPLTGSTPNRNSRADPAEELRGDLQVGVDLVVVELQRVVAEHGHDQRREDRDEDQQQDHDGTAERDLVAPQPPPGDLSEGAALDLLAAHAFGEASGWASAAEPVTSRGADIPHHPSRSRSAPNSGDTNRSVASAQRSDR